MRGRPFNANGGKRRTMRRQRICEFPTLSIWTGILRTVLCLLLFATQTEFARRGGNEKGKKNRIMSLFYGVINKIIIGESDTNCVNKLRQKKSFEMFNRFRDIVSLLVSICCWLVYENSPLCVNWCVILAKVIQFKYHPFFWSFDISIMA